MLRGVNKNIIEVNDTENQYFEKAILFVRPAHKNKTEEQLRTAATAYLSTANASGAVKTMARTRPLKLRVATFMSTKIKYICMLCAAVAALILFAPV